jgi:hypothetical protein
LAEARQLRDDPKRRLIEGFDPALVKMRWQVEAKAAAGNTFEVIVDEFLDKFRRDKRAESTITKDTKSFLVNFVLFFLQ